uniref:Arrestin C-terminal-like domain-containing protein n=1 Tax=Globodera rostochiensis TaxID=31243 RepID=A0A914H6L9_GLORO
MVNPSETAAAQPSAHETDVFEQFEIVFDAGPEPVFHGGELISGQLKIKLKNEIILNAIHLQFKGKALWIGAARKADKEGQTEKIYFDKNFMLLERPPGHPEPGHFKWAARFAYSLPFECPLPVGCESSYESAEAHIRFFARAILETEKREKFIVKKAFSIVSPPDLHHLVPPHSEPITQKETVRFGGCCCRNKISAEVELAKSAFAPGEDIVGAFYIDSRTARNAVDHIEVRLLDGAERIQPEQPEQLAKNADNAVPETNNEKESEGGGRKSKSATNKKQSKTTPRASTKAPEAVTSLCRRVVAGRKLDAKSLLAAETEKHGRRRPVRVGMRNVVFIRVPAVIPTIQSEADDQQPFVTNKQQDDEVQQEGEQRFSKLLESPSTATIRARKVPFIGVKYALQIALGTHILMEIPIKVHPIPIYAKDIAFRPFAGGAQPITESDEANLRGGPFTFTPQYPIYLESALQPEPSETSKEAIKAQTESQLLPAAEQSPNGTATADGMPQAVEVQLVPNGSKPYQDQQQQEDDEEQQQQMPNAQMDQQQQQTAAQPHVAQQTTVVVHEVVHSQHDMTQNGDEPVLNGQLNGDVHANEQHVVEETYEVANEDGSKTTIRKSTERHQSTVDHSQSHDGEDGMKTDQQQQQLNNNNQQMDVSMNG